MTEMQRTDLQYAQQLDRQDALAKFRDEFVRDDPDLIYLDGNSLGSLPKRTLAILRDTIERQWGQRLIRSWNEDWFAAPQRVGAKIAALIGADTDEVIVADSTSVNLYKLTLATLQARAPRNTIVSDELNFPSDLYVVQGLTEQYPSGCRFNIIRCSDDPTLNPAAVATALDANTALLTLSHVAFQSGAVNEMKLITELAHEVGTWVLWDLCHSVGVMPIDVHADNIDLAVGCTYKYLNGGPGAPAFLFVRRELQSELRNPICGWFGQKNQFAFSTSYTPVEGIRRFQIGTPPILSLAAIEPGIDMLLEAGIDRIRDKSKKQTDYLLALWDRFLKPHGFIWKSPQNSETRGSHVALGHPEAWRITQALIHEMRVIPDFRIPDSIRLGISPLLLSFAELHEAVMRIRRVVIERRYEKYSADRNGVT